MGSSSPLRDEQEGLKKYPRTYSVDTRTKRARDAVAIAPLFLIAAVSLLDLVGLVNNAVTPFGLLALGLFAGLYAFLISRPTHRTVILYEDGIAVLGWRSARKLERNEILGRRMDGTRRPYGGAHYVIVPADKAARVLRLPSSLHVDEDFRSWMDGIPKVAKDGSSKS